MSSEQNNPKNVELMNFDNKDTPTAITLENFWNKAISESNPNGAAPDRKYINGLASNPAPTLKGKVSDWVQGDENQKKVECSIEAFAGRSTSMEYQPYDPDHSEPEKVQVSKECTKTYPGQPDNEAFVTSGSNNNPGFKSEEERKIYLYPPTCC